MKVGDIVKCIKQVSYNSVFGVTVKHRENIIYHNKYGKYIVMEITKQSNEDNSQLDDNGEPTIDYHHNVLIEDQFGGGGGVGFVLEDNIEDKYRRFNDYFITIKQHRKKVLDGYRNR